MIKINLLKVQKYDDGSSVRFANLPGKPSIIRLCKQIGSLREFSRLFQRTGEIDNLCATPIHLPNGTVTPLFEALEAYRGQVANDKYFSEQMTALDHTIYLLESLGRIADSKDQETALMSFGKRGIGGLQDCTHVITALNQAYWSLTDADKMILWIGGLLHDIGKTSLNRENHPVTGLKIFKDSPAIAKSIREILSPLLSDAELDNAQLLIECIIEKHDTLGGLAITREHSIFETTDTIKQIARDPQLIKRLLVLLALVNFSDIDAQGRNGIFTNQKSTAFYETYLALPRIIEEQNGVRDYAWWGRERLLAWARGDLSALPDQVILTILEYELPRAEDRNIFFETLGRLNLFDNAFNLATAIGRPRAAIKLLIWLAEIIQANNITHVTRASRLFLDPAEKEQLCKAVDLPDILSAEISAPKEGETHLIISLKTPL